VTSEPKTADENAFVKVTRLQLPYTLNGADSDKTSLPSDNDAESRMPLAAPEIVTSERIAIPLIAMTLEAFSVHKDEDKDSWIAWEYDE
jgi:hypothetical protein